MKKLIFLMFLLSVTMGMSAQKMTIKTANGQTVEVICDGVAPTEIVIVRDSVIFKVPQVMASENTETNTETALAEADTIEADTLNDAAEPTVGEEELTQEVDTIEVDTLGQDLDETFGQSLAREVVEEFFPGYTELEEKLPQNISKEEVIRGVSEEVLGKEATEAIDFWGTVLGNISFTKDTTFVAKYEQRKPKLSWRRYGLLTVGGSFGKNDDSVDDAIADQINAEDYGDDTSNEHKFGGFIKYSNVNQWGSEVDGEWQPNFLGLAWSWGGLVAYSYEKDMGSYVNVLGKVGFQIGTSIVLGVDGMLGCSVKPFNTFYTNGMNHSVLNSSAFCLTYGIEVWGTLNFSKDVCTCFYGRWLNAVKPANISSNLPEGWETVYEDFDPTCWSVGLAVGYKFGAPEPISTDKRLFAGINTGYQFMGNQQGMLVSAEFGRFTHIAPRAYFNYGLAVERLYDKDDKEGNYTSVLLSLGLKVQSPYSRWFWESKLYGGLGNNVITFTGSNIGSTFTQSSKKICAKVALSLGGGVKLGKCLDLFGSWRLGYHFGKAFDIEGFDDVTYSNLHGFNMDMRSGVRYTF